MVMEVLQGWIDTKIISTSNSSSSSSAETRRENGITNSRRTWSPNRVDVVWIPSSEPISSSNDQNPTGSAVKVQSSIQDHTSENEPAENVEVGIKHYYEVKLKVRGYKPEELQVHISSNDDDNNQNFVIIEGKHVETTSRIDSITNQILVEETICRRFKRSFELPENIIKNQIECRLSSDEYLIVSALIC